MPNPSSTSGYEDETDWVAYKKTMDDAAEATTQLRIAEWRAYFASRRTR